MSEKIADQATAAPADQTAAPAPKPKRPKPKSMIMIGEQTAALFENARLAKERGEKVGWSASIFPQEIAETLGIVVLYPENHAAGIAARGARRAAFVQDVDVAAELVLLAVGSGGLDDVEVHTGGDGLAFVAAVPALGGIGERAHFLSPAVEDVALE